MDNLIFLAFGLIFFAGLFGMIYPALVLYYSAIWLAGFFLCLYLIIFNVRS